MSQTSPNPADQTATSSYATNEYDIKPLSNSGSVSEDASFIDNTVPPEPMSTSQRLKYQHPPHWRQVLSLRAKAVAIAIAISMLPVLGIGATVYYFANRSISEQSTQTKQTRASDPTDIASVPQTQMPLTLAIETAVAVLLLVGLIAAFFANRAMRPTPISDATNEELDNENLESADIAFARLAAQFAQNQAMLPGQQEAETNYENLIQEITHRIRESVFLEDVLKTTVKEVRRALKADRVFCYRFNSDWSGFVVAESVALGWPSCLKIKVADTYFSESGKGIEEYKNGRICVINNIYKQGLTDCHIKLLEQFAIKANLIAPILQDNQLFGLMIANQCSDSRIWEKQDVDLFVQLTTQVGFALDQASFLEKQEAEVERAQLITEITLRIRQSLYLEDMLKTTVKEIRRALKTDRVLIYGLDTNWDGIVVAESVATAWPQTLRVKLNDPYLKETYVENSKNGRIRVINDIYQEIGLADYQIKLLEQFAVKAELVAPILRNNQLLGIMIAQQCSGPRIWEKHNVDLFVQLATQVGLAVFTASLLEQKE